MPPHRRYVEPYFGGGAVLFHKPYTGVAEFVNDLDGELMNFWECLQSPAAYNIMGRQFAATPLAKQQFEEAMSRQSTKSLPAVDRAIDFFIRYRQSRQGLGKDFVTPTRRIRRGMNEQVSAWLTAVDCLPEAHNRLRQVEIRNEPATDLIKELDWEETCFYTDPPYLQETRTAKKAYGDLEMDENDHMALLATLSKIKGKFLLSGYRSQLYDDFSRIHQWKRHEHEIVNNASSKKTKDTKVECIWTNF